MKQFLLAALAGVAAASNLQFFNYEAERRLQKDITKSRSYSILVEQGIAKENDPVGSTCRVCYEDAYIRAAQKFLTSDQYKGLCSWCALNFKYVSESDKREQEIYEATQMQRAKENTEDDDDEVFGHRTGRVNLMLVNTLMNGYTQFLGATATTTFGAAVIAAASTLLF